MKRNTYSGRLLAIDPGVKGTGYAIFEERTLLDCGTFVPPAKEEWLNKVEFLEDELADVLWQRNMDDRRVRVVMEKPVFFRGAIGYMSAASGTLQKLSMLTGVYIGTFFSRGFNAAQIRLVSPSEWKGQLSKEAGNRQILKVLEKTIMFNREELNIEMQTDHAIDAIGIGLYEMGLF